MSTILAIDDEVQNLEMVEYALDKEYEVIPVRSGKAALDYLKEHTPDLILLDIMMPEMNGEETLVELKKIKDFDTPVVALTADAIQGAKEKYLKEGFDDYIAKPFTRDQIKEKLDKILK